MMDEVSLVLEGVKCVVWSVQKAKVYEKSWPSCGGFVGGVNESIPIRPSPLFFSGSSEEWMDHK